MKLLLIALALGFPAVSSAQEIVDPRDIELSKGMALTVSRGEQAAAAVLSIDFNRFSSDDGESVVFAELENITRRYKTTARANRVAGFLSADMNWDGNVTRSEVEMYLSGQSDPRLKGPQRVDGFLRDGDQNGDEIISLSEMIEHARTELPDTGKPDRVDMNEMLGWDLNQDGVLEWREVLKVIAAKQPPK